MESKAPLTRAQILAVVSELMDETSLEMDCRAVSGNAASEMLLSVMDLKSKAQMEVSHGEYKVTLRKLARKFLGNSAVTLELKGTGLEITVSLAPSVSVKDLQSFLKKAIEPLS